MLVKLVSSRSIKVGNKLLRGNKAVTVIDIINVTNSHMTIVCDDDIVFTRSDKRLLKVIGEGAPLL